jgi:hypothetical protein
VRLIHAAGSHFTDEDIETAVPIISKMIEERGNIAPEDVVEAARPTKAALHRYFTWNNREAANKYRIEEAKYLIRSCMAEPEHSEAPDEQKPLPAFRVFHSIKIEGEPRYVTMRQVISSTEYHAQIVANALIELRGWMERYKTYQDLAYITDVLNGLI